MSEEIFIRNFPEKNECRRVESFSEIKNRQKDLVKKFMELFNKEVFDENDLEVVKEDLGKYFDNILNEET